MVSKRWWLILAGFWIAGLSFAQTGSGSELPGTHTLPYSRYRPIPPKNYRVAPSQAPLEARSVRWYKNGLFDPQRFFQQFQSPSQRTRAPRWDRDLSQAPTDDIHPVYYPGQARIFFASNATGVVNGRLANPGPYYRIWRGDLDDGAQPPQAVLTNLTQITGDTPEEQFTSQFHPAINQQATILAYVITTASGNTNIVVRNFATNTRIVLTTDTDGVTQNLRPTLSPGGNLVAFASNRLLPNETEADRRFRIYVMRTDGRPFDDGVLIRRYTFPEPGENDVEPAWSPDGRRIAFARVNDAGFSYIYIVDVDTRIAVQWTSFEDPGGNRPNDRQPAWSRVPGNPNAPGLILFSSTRKSFDNQGRHQRQATSNGVDVVNQIYDIYYVSANVAESTANPAISLTVDPSTPDRARPAYPSDSTPTAGAQYPTAAIVERNRLAYQSTRLVEGNIQGDHDIWETLFSDISPPVLEILPLILPGKELFPGDEVTVRVKVSDFQTGIEAVRVQFKDPDSAEQDAEGLEHKLYWLFQFDPFFPNRILVAEGAEAYVPLFVEVGCEAINPFTYEYVPPYSLARLGFGGSLDDTLQLEPVEGEEGVYEVKWRTPDVPSDFYVDIIVQDAAGNEFIYDNISGFTTRRFVGANNILLVSDYAGGQIFVQNRIGDIGNSLTRPTWQPIESYWTDNPTGKPPFDLTQPPSGSRLRIIGDGAIVGPAGNIRADTLGENTPYRNLYDIWRVQCRNPITPAVLASYLPRTEQEPTGLTGSYRNKLHAERIVIWASPYTGNVWAGTGHLIDPEVQTLLRAFRDNGGRFVISGQDVAWALTLLGTLGSRFLNEVLRAEFEPIWEYDTAEDVFFVDVPYQGLRHQVDSQGLETIPGTPAPGDPNPIARNPAGRPIWVRFEGSSIVPDQPAAFRISHPAIYVSTPTLDVFDVIGLVGPLYTDAAWNQVWLDVVRVTPPTGSPYRYANAGAIASITNRAGTYYEDPTTRSKVTYFAFGIEGVNSTYNAGPPGTLWCRAYRNKILHNAYGWMTHNVLEGVVRQYDPSRREYNPLPRALVRVLALDPPSIAGQFAGYAITDSNGFYRIVGLEAGVYLVEAVRPGFRIQHPETFDAVARNTDNPVVINLVMLAAPPGQIIGQVVDINDQPVRYPVVRATSVDDPELQVEAIGDIDGRFLIPRVPAGQWDVTVVGVTEGGYNLPPIRPVGPPQGVFRVTVSPNETTVLPENFVLEPLPGTVEGVVTDANTNAPIANARVFTIAGGLNRETFTDTNGRYSLNLPAGSYALTATAPGYAPSAANVQVIADQTITQNFALNRLPPGTITGRVLRKPTNTPEPGVTIEVLFGTEVVATGTTDANGNYTIPNVPPADYVVRPRKSGYTFEPPTRTITVVTSQTVTVDLFRSEPLKTFPRGRTLVSAPYDYTQDVKVLLSVPTSASFQFFTWLPAQGRYLFYPNAPANRFVLGRGYFLDSSVDLPLATEGTPADESQPFDIPLSKGWNLIGNPFRFNIAWSQTEVLNPQTNTFVSNSTAVGLGLIGNALWGYSFGAYSVANRMEPWRGYWVYARQETTLRIPPGARVLSGDSRSVASAQGGWLLTLEAESNGERDRAYVGVSRSASPGYDPEHDLLKPPPVARDYVYISLPRLNWGAHSGYYGVDVQPATRSASWEFTVETGRPNQQVTLRWPNIHSLPRTANLMLVNLETGERRYLRTTSSYTFRTSSTGTCRFRIETTSSGQLLRIQGVQVRSSRGNQHTIAFSLTGEAMVQVNILAGGKTVRSLMHQASRSAGLQQVSWDGRDQNGIALPPGTYTVEIRATSQEGQSARAVTNLILTR